MYIEIRQSDFSLLNEFKVLSDSGGHRVVVVAGPEGDEEIVLAFDREAILRLVAGAFDL